MGIVDEHGGWPQILGALTGGEAIGAGAARAALGAVLAGEATDAQMAGFIVALKAKGETAEELSGLVEAMLDAAVPLHLPPGAIDIVGTGGSPGRRTGALNVSTMAAVVAAGAGATVCKHGNNRASSTSGSFDLLEALGVAVGAGPDELSEQVRGIGLGFAYARAYHPAMRNVAGVRTELGIPSVFNLLGPLSHPGQVRRQVVGVADPARARMVAEVLRDAGSERSMVVHGHGPLDELSLTGPSAVTELDDGRIRSYEVSPADAGLAPARPEDLRGGDATVNAAVLRAVLAGDRGAHRDIVVLNAAAGLMVAGMAGDLGSGAEMAAAAVDDGRAAAKLEALISSSRR